MLISFSAYLWQLMRYNMLQLLKNLRFHSHGKEINDGDILQWANNKVKSSGSKSRMNSFKVSFTEMQDDIYCFDSHVIYFCLVTHLWLWGYHIDLRRLIYYLWNKFKLFLMRKKNNVGIWMFISVTCAMVLVSLFFESCMSLYFFSVNNQAIPTK